MDEIFNYTTDHQDDYYDILGCSEHSTTEQIVTEYKARVLDCHPDKHPDDPSAVEKFKKLQKAKEILTDSESRHSYDVWRNSGLAIPYEKWASFRKATHTSMHWASRKSQPMLEESEQAPTGHTTSKVTSEPKAAPSCSSTSFLEKKHKKGIPWERDPASDMLKKFRSYEI